MRQMPLKNEKQMLQCGGNVASALLCWWAKSFLVFEDIWYLKYKNSGELVTKFEKESYCFIFYRSHFGRWFNDMV